MIKRKNILILGVVIVVICLSFFINSKYLFSPFSYKKDDVSYLSWGSYTNPMSVRYNSLDLKASDIWKTIKIEDTKEAKFIFEELKKGKKVSVHSAVNNNISREVIITSSNGTVVLNVFIDNDIKLARIKSTNTVKTLTKSLVNMINKRMKETK